MKFYDRIVNRTTKLTISKQDNKVNDRILELRHIYTACKKWSRIRALGQVGRLPLKIKEENAFVASSDGLKTRRTKRTAEKPIQLTVVSEEAVSSRPLLSLAAAYITALPM